MSKFWFEDSAICCKGWKKYLCVILPLLEVPQSERIMQELETCLTGEEIPSGIFFEILIKDSSYCQTSDLGLRLEVDFVFPLSQEQQEQQE